MFSSTGVANQGSVYMDPREVMLDTSDSFVDFRNYITNSILRDVDNRGNRYKKIAAIGWDSLIFKELEVKLVNGLMFIGAEFDDMFIGRP